MPDDTPYKVTFTGKVIRSRYQTRRMEFPYPPEEEYRAGMDCICSAHGKCECACGADWTDPEVYKLRAELATAAETIIHLRKELEEARNALSEARDTLNEKD